ncbi:MAG: hypothetical protein ACRC6B_08020 [Fusobacteriaceae bacterium]
MIDMENTIKELEMRILAVEKRNEFLWSRLGTIEQTTMEEQEANSIFRSMKEEKVNATN